MRRLLLVLAIPALLATACGDDDAEQSDTEVFIDCVRAEAPDPEDCSAALEAVQPGLTGAPQEALEAYAACQTAEATDPGTAEACQDEADTLVSALEEAEEAEE